MTILRISSYLTVLGMGMQSYRLEEAMKYQVLQMTRAAQKATVLQSRSEADMSLSKENLEKSVSDKLESEALHEQSIEQQLEAERLAGLAEADRASSEEHMASAAEEQTEAELHEASAAVEEAAFEAETEKALAEAAEAAEYEAETEADALATGFCQFIPGVDILCDVVGGASSLALEAAAAKWLAESAVDGAAATADKVKENADVDAAASLELLVEKDEEISAELNAKANEEQMSSKEHETLAEEDETQSEIKLDQSEEESVLAEEEEATSAEEETESGEQWKKSATHGLSAMWNALAAFTMATFSVLFFAIRIYTAVLLPDAVSVINFFPATMQLPNGTRPRSLAAFLGNAWVLLPLREVSYTSLHAGIFMLSVIVFSDKFAMLKDFDIRSRGGNILLFAIFAATLQATFLHAILRAIKDYQLKTSRSSMFMQSSFSKMFVRYFIIFTRALVYLTPLFVIETLILWLLFGTSIFSPAISSIYIWTPFTLICVLSSLFCLHCWFFESSQLDQVDENITETCLNTSSGSASREVMSASEGDALLGSNHSNPKSMKDCSSTPMTQSVAETDQEGVLYTVGLTSASYRNIFTDREKKGALDAMSACGTKQSPVDVDGDGSGWSSGAWERYLSVSTTTKVNKAEQSKEMSIASNKVGMVHQVVSPLLNYWEDIKLPLEMLILVCVCILIRSCIPVVAKLWPTFFSHVIATIPRWYLTMICGLVLVLFVISSKVSLGQRSGHIGVLTGNTLRTLEV